MKLFLSIMLAATLLTSCSRVEEKIVDETEQTIKEDFGPSPVDG